MGLPVPPEDNHLFRNVTAKGKSFRVKTKQYREFNHAIDLWMVHNRNAILRARKKIPSDQPLYLVIKVNFKWSRVFCKDGRVKRMDGQNRMKATCDALSVILGNDDRMVFDARIQKRWNKFTDREWIDVEIIPVTLNI